MDIQSFGKSLALGSPISEKSTAPPPAEVANPQSAALAQTDIAATQAARAPSTAEVIKAVSDINKAIQATSQNVEFSVDTDTHEVVVRVIDQQTKQVLRQMPSVEAIEIAKSLDKLQGLLIRQQA